MSSKSSKPVLGLIGGMGSGKSLVAGELVQRGGFLIAGDKLGHEALRQPDIRDKVIARWGTEIVGGNGEIDRRRLGAIVFGDAAERLALEKLVFPFIERRIEEEIAAAQEMLEVRFIVLDAAILLEAGWDRYCDFIVFIEAPREMRWQRLFQQRGWSAKEVAAREQAQWPVALKRGLAHFVVDNSGPIQQLPGQIDALLTSIGISRNHLPN